MIPKIRHIDALDSFILRVCFDDGKVVLYDVKSDIDRLPAFKPLLNEIGLFKSFQIDESRTCVFWSDQMDLASDTIYEFGTASDSCIAAEDAATYK